jgi:23S rRNA (adenine1618-N6)-methyltransferase
MSSPRKPSRSPNAAPAANAKGQLHPRNRHQGRYDFPQLIKACPELGAFVIVNPYGNQSIDFANPEAVRVFNRALLAQLYGIRHWDIPAGYLCPPVPGRADYIHGLADLLAEEHDGEVPRGAGVRVLDVGCGANCIYPLLGHADYGWHFVGSDIDPTAVAAARAIVQSNQLQSAIELRLQPTRTQVFNGLLHSDERFALTLCNPPFHASAEEAASGSRRKWKNLGKLDPSRTLPKLNFGGQSSELWCPGGELTFVRRMIEESRAVAQQVLWFSCLVSKAGNLELLERALAKAGVAEKRVVSMAQGQKQSRFLAWTFHDQAARKNW